MRDARITSHHPRLYFNASELPALRERRANGPSAAIWCNLQGDADALLNHAPRSRWIAPVKPDPRYENLYDRFYAIMGDLAITEHLAFAYALSGDHRYGEAARAWTLASCRIWSAEADSKPDGGKAYAVCRLLKGVSVGFDCAFDRFTDAEQQEIRTTLHRIARTYYDHYFSRPEYAGPQFHTHHAIVEYASFGITALTLLGTVEEADGWLEAVIAKFERDLLPCGLATDGAQIEGGSFWASTMQYRLLFMDALRRVTGIDLFTPFESNLSAELALASVATGCDGDGQSDHASVLLQPYYAQLDYYSPVLLGLAKFYDRPLLRRLALWDKTLGCRQRTRAVTPNGEALSFSFGGYAYVWYTDGPTQVPDHQRRAWWFPSVDEAYLRSGWEPNGIVVGVKYGELVVHAGGTPVLVEPLAWKKPESVRPISAVTDTNTTAEIQCRNNDEDVLKVTLHRPDRLILRRKTAGTWTWRHSGAPERNGNSLVWPNGATLSVTGGTLAVWEPQAITDTLSVANGLLELADPAPAVWSRVTIKPPDDGQVVLEVRMSG